MAITTEDTVSLEYVGRLPEGEVFDTSREDVAEEEGLAEAQPEREYEPLEVTVGAGEVIEGLDEALVGMEVGSEDSIEIPPEKAYGEYDESQTQEFEREQFEEMLQGATPEEGMRIQSPQAGVGRVTEVTEDSVTVDFNHELAGETLVFDVEIVAIE
ncbi:FKBP-type peptidyl-prolyl cis-trans isomerase [Halospeciosus flavus]|uniref:Peptidyl-prolyl cis-trans isomerase n=1 Tax=Halospeciosus flavus TaxID=3032283 RepID=A0ABD5Z5R7_9EURY|nr:peptidylprolyl isomerase [Halospeciosus flavus]